MIDERKQLLLKLVIEQYIETAGPVGSHIVVEQGKLQISGATVRNELRDLEEMGYLTHPHTSAGRIPTEKGYRYYVEKMMTPVPLKKKVQDDYQKIAHESLGEEEKLKRAAKFLAEVSGNTILVAFSPNSFYYTGIRNLFSQPEFQEVSQTISISEIFDQCEERIDDLFDAIDEGDVRVLIGKENPFGSLCSIVGVRVGETNVVMLLGPLRMRYAENISLLSLII